MTTPRIQEIADNQQPPGGPASAGVTGRKPVGWRRILVMLALLGGALIFLFPFYYMVIGSLQRTPDTSVAGAFPAPGNLTLANYVQINASLNIGQALLNSGIFTGGVVLCTLVFGMLAGYALAMLHFRGRGTVFSSMLLLVVPFQLLMSRSTFSSPATTGWATRISG